VLRCCNEKELAAQKTGRQQLLRGHTTRTRNTRCGDGSAIGPLLDAERLLEQCFLRFFYSDTATLSRNCMCRPIMPCPVLPVWR
jgi:hypothetical protein